MGFKADASFLRFLSMGAAGVHNTIHQLQLRGFTPVELERYCGSNKIWSTKVKRLRLPDLLCVKTGLRVEVRAKTDLKIRMSDAPGNPDRVWDAGLRDNDVAAFIKCTASDVRPTAADEAVFFRIGELRRSVDSSKLGPPKSASEGAERDRTWPATVPSRSGSVLQVSPDRLVVEMDADDTRAPRKQTYNIREKNPYVSPGDRFAAGETILAGTPASMVDLDEYLKLRYHPLNDFESANDVDRYAAVKSLRFREEAAKTVVPALESLLNAEQEERVKLEAAGSAAFFDMEMGKRVLLSFVWENDERPDLRMEAVLIFTELGNNAFSEEELYRIAADPRFENDEIRQAAIWGLGRTGLKAYRALVDFIDAEDDNVALHAIAAFGSDTPRAVIERLVHDLTHGNERRASAASESLRIIGSSEALDALIVSVGSNDQPADWVLATIGRLPHDMVRARLQGSPLMRRVEPILLLSRGANWLAEDSAMADVAFLLKQDIRS